MRTLGQASRIGRMIRGSDGVDAPRRHCCAGSNGISGMAMGTVPVRKSTTCNSMRKRSKRTTRTCANFSPPSPSSDPRTTASLPTARGVRTLRPTALSVHQRQNGSAFAEQLEQAISRCLAHPKLGGEISNFACRCLAELPPQEVTDRVRLRHASSQSMSSISSGNGSGIVARSAKK